MKISSTTNLDCQNIHKWENWDITTEKWSVFFFIFMKSIKENECEKKDEHYISSIQENLVNALTYG